MAPVIYILFESQLTMNKNRVNEIDLLRFLAALLVVFFHYAFRGYAADNMSVMPYPLLAPFSKYGYLGVELFFMISGFVILMTASSGSLRGFFVSRLVRLYPAFWVCCTITFVMILSIGSPYYSVSLSQYLVNMTMLSSFFGVPSIDGSYWSLFVEIKFYALVALILAIGKIQRVQAILVLWLIASFVLEIFPLGKLQEIFITDCSAYFIAGATCYLIWSQGISLMKLGIIFLSWGLALYQSLNDLSNFERHYSTTMSGFVVVGIITVFFSMLLLIAFRRTAFWGRNPWTLVGALTYPLYLIHQNVGFVIFNFTYPAVNSHLLFWGTMFGVILVASLIHIFIESKLALPFKNGLNYFIDNLTRLNIRSS